MRKSGNASSLIATYCAHVSVHLQSLRRNLQIGLDSLCLKYFANVKYSERRVLMTGIDRERAHGKLRAKTAYSVSSNGPAGGGHCRCASEFGRIRRK